MDSLVHHTLPRSHQRLASEIWEEQGSICKSLDSSGSLLKDAPHNYIPGCETECDKSEL